MRKVVVAATQMSCTWDREATLAKAEKLVWESAGISGFRKLPDVWRFWGRRSCFTPLPSAASRFFRRIPNWQRCMQGHAAANIMPVVASNRIGHEVQKNSEMTFYGSSFIADETGGLVAEADRETEGVITAEFDLDAIAQKRREWGVFRDRRPEMYGTLLTHGC